MAKVKHNIVNVEKAAGTVLATELVTVEIPEDMDNGTIIDVKGVKDGEYEVHECVALAGGDVPTGRVALLASVENLDDERNTKADFYNKEGKLGRAYILTEGAVFSLVNGDTPLAYTTGSKVFGAYELKPVTAFVGTDVAYEVVKKA